MRKTPAASVAAAASPGGRDKSASGERQAAASIAATSSEQMDVARRFIQINIAPLSRLSRQGDREEQFHGFNNVPTVRAQNQYNCTATMATMATALD
jgi:hypothetical protein